MRRSEFVTFMNSEFGRILKSFEQTNREYAQDDEAFENFNKLSRELGIDRKQVLWVYAMKHKDAVANYLKGFTSQREDVTGRITDEIVYRLLLLGMIAEERSQEPAR